MKTILSAFVAVVLAVTCGIAAGKITTQARVSYMKEHLSVYRTVDLDTDRAQNSSFSKKDSAEQTGTPRFEIVGSAVYEFGSMEREQEQSHTFVLKNTGTAPGLLKLIRTSCKCTLSDELGKSSEVAPGETKDIALTWKPLNYSKEFEQSAQIKTEDPDNTIIELRIRGMVIQKIVPVPPVMSLAGIPTDRETTHTMKLFAYQRDDLKIVGHELRRKQQKDKFELEYRSLTPQELEQEKGALSGQLVTVKVEEGLRFGLTNQLIRLETNFPDAEQFVEIPLFASVESEVSITGVDPKHRFNKINNRLEMGTISKGKPAATTLNLMVKPTKDAPENIEMKVVESEFFPKGGIIADLGSAREFGKVTRFPLKITIPADQPPVALQGSAQDGDVGIIVIETNLKTASRIEIFVSYNVVE